MCTTRCRYHTGTEIIPVYWYGLAERAVSVIRNTVEELITKCKKIVEAEGEQIEGEEYVNETDPSILRFLLASREEVFNSLGVYFLWLW
ncbi:hypothetical protein BHM03_00033237 [Ensete ventricosum]|uniref:Uncharacterized protein n=1 Tax=Ensete ventricosum TaxID=4639 RepID=A0A445MIV6_ENSVE|nr:hypothetical protein BHM03_00033237 [Ensete ventricosum]